MMVHSSFARGQHHTVNHWHHMDACIMNYTFYYTTYTRLDRNGDLCAVEMSHFTIQCEKHKSIKPSKHRFIYVGIFPIHWHILNKKRTVVTDVNSSNMPQSITWHQITRRPLWSRRPRHTSESYLEEHWSFRPIVFLVGKRPVGPLSSLRNLQPSYSYSYQLSFQIS